MKLVDTGRHQAEGRTHLPVRRSSASAPFRPRSQEYRQSPFSAVTKILITSAKDSKKTRARREPRSHLVVRRITACYDCGYGNSPRGRGGFATRPERTSRCPRL